MVLSCPITPRLTSKSSLFIIRFNTDFETITLLPLPSTRRGRRYPLNEWKWEEKENFIVLQRWNTRNWPDESAKFLSLPNVPAPMKIAKITRDGQIKQFAEVSCNRGTQLFPSDRTQHVMWYLPTFFRFIWNTRYGDVCETSSWQSQFVKIY